MRALGDTRARGNGACRWRSTAPRSPRVRGFGNGKFFERAGCGKLVAALLEKATPLPRLKRKNSGVAVGVLFDERTDELGNFVLLVTRKLAGFLKDLAQLACRTFAA